MGIFPSPVNSSGRAYTSAGEIRGKFFGLFRKSHKKRMHAMRTSIFRENRTMSLGDADDKTTVPMGLCISKPFDPTCPLGPAEEHFFPTRPKSSLWKGVAGGQWQASHASNEKEFEKVKKKKFVPSCVVRTSDEKKDGVMKDDERFVHGDTDDDDDDDDDDGNDGDVGIVDGDEKMDIDHRQVREKGVSDKKKRLSPLFKLKKKKIEKIQTVVMKQETEESKVATREQEEIAEYKSLVAKQGFHEKIYERLQTKEKSVKLMVDWIQKTTSERDCPKEVVHKAIMLVFEYVARIDNPQETFPDETMWRQSETIRGKRNKMSNLLLISATCLNIAGKVEHKMNWCCPSKLIENIQVLNNYIVNDFVMVERDILAEMEWKIFHSKTPLFFLYRIMDMCSIVHVRIHVIATRNMDMCLANTSLMLQPADEIAVFSLVLALKTLNLHTVYLAKISLISNIPVHDIMSKCLHIQEVKDAIQV